LQSVVIVNRFVIDRSGSIIPDHRRSIAMSVFVWL
jgi:hypothetical protein